MNTCGHCGSKDHTTSNCSVPEAELVGFLRGFGGDAVHAAHLLRMTYDITRKAEDPS